MARTRAEGWAIAFLGLSSLGLHLWNLDWGLPTWEHSLRVFGRREKIDELSPELVRLREQVYSQYRDMGTDSMSDQTEPGREISRAMLLHGMRSHLLMPRSADEQQVIGALSRTRQAIQNLKFPFLVYGYFFFGCLGLVLGLAHFAGYLTLTTDIAFYFLHPEHVSRIYATGRFVGAAATLATIAILYREARLWFGWRTAALACLLFSWHPLVVTMHSHIIKPWSFATLFSVALLAMCMRLLRGSKRLGDFLWAGAASGLVASNLYFYALNWLWIPLVRGMAQGGRFSRSDLRPIAMSALLAAALFFAMNPQTIFYAVDIMRAADIFRYGRPHPDFLETIMADSFLTWPGIFYLPALPLAALAARQRPLEAALPRVIARSAARENGARELRFLWCLMPMMIFYAFSIGEPAHHILPMYPAMLLLVSRGITWAWESRAWRIVPPLLASAALAASLAPSLAWLRDSDSRNLETAGDWIRRHVRPGSTIAMTAPLPAPGCPAFPYLDYRLVYYPYWRADLHPTEDYVVNSCRPELAFAKTERFQREYRLRLFLPLERFSYLNLPAPMRHVFPCLNPTVEIWQRSGNSTSGGSASGASVEGGQRPPRSSLAQGLRATKTAWTKKSRGPK